MKLPLSPCKNCKERHIGCHSDCGRYLDFQIEIKEYHKMVSDERIEDRRLADLQWLVWRKHHKGTQRP